MKGKCRFDYTTIDLSDQDAADRRAELAAVSSDTTAPKVLIEGEVYTLEQLQELNEEGKLAALLAGDMDLK